MGEKSATNKRYERPQARRGITHRLPTQRSQITNEQAIFFSRLINELGQAWRSPPGEFRNLPEYERLIEGAYACGFVCRDISSREADYHPFVQEPRRLETATFGEIRRFIHFLMRGERWNDNGEDIGGGLIHETLRCGALHIIAERLSHESEWRSDC